MTLTEFLLARIAEDEAETRVMRNRILAECEAKRRIIARYQTHAEHYDPGMEPREGVQWLEWAVQCLALPHANHPDYQAEWRP